MMEEDERERIPGLHSTETEGPTTMLFSLEGGDVKGSVIIRNIDNWFIKPSQP